MTTKRQRRLIPWFLFNVFLLLSIGILITGFLIYQKQEQRLKSDTHRSLAAIADLKVSQIVQWRYDRIGDGNLIRENAPLTRQIAEFFKTGVGIKRKQELINWMKSFRKHYGYGNILLIDPKGNVRLSADEKDNSIGAFARSFLPEIASKHEVIFTDLHKSEDVAYVHIDVLVPLISPDDKDSKVFGIVLLRIDPNIELFPLVQSWPTSRRTSETILLECEGNEVVFLNELRYKKNTTLSLRLPISNQQLPAAMAARGIEGTVEGIDYRNIPVLAALRKIPNSQWFMVAKVDREEIYAPLWYQAWIVGGAVFLLIIATGSIIGFWWRHQRARFYRQLYEAELERKALVTHYDYFVKYANDIILLLHKDGKIVEANERACISYGYTREEIIQLNIRDLRSPKTRAIVDIQMQQVDKQNGMVFETEHLRKDGTMFPVEVSSRVFEVEGTKFYQSIIRDITERNRLNEILEKERQELKLIIDSSPIIVFYKDKEGRFIRVNRTFAEALQIPEENFVGKTVFDIYSQKIAQGMNDDDQEILKSGRPKLNIIEQYESASGIRWVQTDKIPICDKNGTPIGLIGFAQDITERKQAEEALRESEEMYKSLVKTSPESITITDLSGKITYVSQRTLELHGSGSAEELIGKSAFELIAPEDQKEAIVNLQKTMEEGIVRDLEYTMLRKNGTRFAAELSAASIKDISGKPKAFIATVKDITERKRAEKALHESEARCRELANSITDIFFALDAELKYTYWNSASEKLTGITAQNAIGKHLYEIFPDTPEIRYAEEIYRDVLKTQQFRSFINSYQKGSQTIFFEISVYPSKEGISVFTKDITERKKAAEALRESEERYKRITQAITDYIYTVYIKNGNVVETRHGEGCIAVTGYSSEEYAADPNLWYRMILDEDRSSVNYQSQRLLAGEDVLPLEHRIVRKNGTIRWIRNTPVTHRNEEGELLSYDGLIQDITERKQAELARMQAEESLRESQQMLQTVLNTIPVRVFWKDVNSKYLGCNLPFALDGGFHSPEELIGKDDFQASWKNQAELYRSDDRLVFETGKPKLGYEEPETTADGNIVWLRTSKVPLLDAQGKIKGVLGTYENITERKRAEVALKESEEKFRLLAENSPNMIFINNHGRVVYANKKCEEMMGYTREEFYSRDFNFITTTAPEYIDLVKTKYVQHMTGKEVAPYEYALISKDGRRIETIINTRLIDFEGESAILGIITDITKRKQAEKALKESEEKFRLSFENANTGMCLVDMNGNLMQVNYRMCEIFGYSKQELESMNVNSIAVPEDKHLSSEFIKEASTGKTDNAVFEKRYCHKDGHIVWGQVSSSLVRDADGKPSYFISHVQDITKRKRAEEALAKQQHLMNMLMDNIPDHIYFKDTESRFIKMNKAQAERFGISDPTQALGKTDFDFFAEDHARPAFEDEKKIIKTGQPLVNLEEKEIWPDGRETWVSTTKVPLYDIDGQIIGTFGISREITERKRTEELLRESEEKYKTIFDYAREAIFIADVESGNILDCNEAACAIVERTKEELIGKHQSILHPPDELVGEFTESFRRHITDRHGRVLNARVITKSGTLKDVEIKANIFNFREKKIIRAFFDDVTERKHSEELLRESEEKYRQLFEVESDALFLIDNESDLILEANTAASILYGYSREELLQMRNVDLSAQPDVAQCVTIEQSTTHIPIRYHRKKNGIIFPVEITATHLNWRGRPAHMPAIRDISERILTEEALRQSEALFKMLVEYSPVAIAVYASNTKKVEYVSKRFSEIFGYCQQDMPWIDDWWSLAYPIENYRKEIETVWNENVRTALQENREVEPMESVVTCKDGSTKYIETALSSIGDQNLLFFLDLTQRRVAEEALRQTHAFNDLLIQTMPFGMDIVDEEGNVLFMSKAMKSLIGTDATGKCCWQVYKDDKQQCNDCPLHEGISFGKLDVLETTGVLDGRIFQISHIGMMYEGKKAMLEVFQDITEQKKLQQELMQSQKMLSIGTLAGGIAHDFNNILGIILGYSAILQSIKDNPQRFSDGIDAIKQAVDRGAGLVRQILTFARKTEIVFKPMSIHDIVRELISMLQQTFPRVITFHTSYDKQLPYINADPSQIHQALLNLCVNARDAMPHGGEIYIKTETISGKKLKENFSTADRDWYACVSVSDTGTGMDELTRNRIFDPFFTTKDKGKGTGLGLSVVYGIIQAHHGFIDVESEVGKGTIFRIYLPVPQDSSQTLESIVKGEEKTPGGHETILLVEDEELLLNMMLLLLETHGYKVLTAKDGIEAIKVYVQHRDEIMLVVTDMGLPKLTGMDEFEKLKEINPQVKLIFASGYLEPEAKTELLNAGAKGFIQKPYVIEEVLLNIRKVLDEEI